MSKPQPTPSMNEARAQAEELVRACNAGDADALARIQDRFPGRTPPIALTEARHVLALEAGLENWQELKTRLLEHVRDVEWAAHQARSAIDDNEVGALRQLLSDYPDLLTWRDPDAEGEVLLQATTSYANFPGAEEEETWNRHACAELLLKQGASMDPRVPLRLLSTGAHEMLALFAAHGALPENLRVHAARGLLDRVQKSFDDRGQLHPSARPDPSLRTGYPEAAQHWPDPEDDAAVVADALLFAARLGQREVAAFLLERSCAQDSDLTARIEADGGREVFLEFLLEHASEGARYDLYTGNAPPPHPIWQCAVDLRLHQALHANDVETIRTLLAREPFLLEERSAPLQARFVEVASYSENSLPILRAFLEAGPALTGLPTAPGARAISYAVEYGHADYLSLLERLWPVPDDLPHAAGRGDLAAVARWFDAAGRPNLGDPARHNPFPDHSPIVSQQEILDRSLAWAVQNGAYETADFLLEHGADINTRWGTHEPASILHECAFAGRLEQVKYLVRRGIDLTIEDRRFGSTAQGWAEYGGQDEVAQFLEEAARRS